MTIYHHIAVWKHGGVFVIRFGDHWILDESVIHRIGEELCSVVDQEDCRSLILNFGGVMRLSSSMLGKVVMLKRHTQAKGGDLILCDIGPEIQASLASTGLDHFLDIAESEADALRTISSQNPMAVHGNLPPPEFC
jgi:anti-anti-sigma factor